MSEVVIDRGFVRVAAGLIHYRHVAAPAGTTSPPLYMAHAGPGSSRGLIPLIAELGASRRVIAPDMMGNGESDPPPATSTDLAFYVDCVIRTLDTLGLDRVDFFGSHSGAAIGVELALAHPDRVGRLILDGLGLFPTDQRLELLTRYAPEVAADDFGGHLAWAWNFVSGLTVHFPYYHTDPRHRLSASPVPPAALRHALTAEVLKVLPTYHLAYRAVFAADLEPRLPLIQHETLVLAADADPLSIYVDPAAALIPGAKKAIVARTDLARTVGEFLGI